MAETNFNWGDSFMQSLRDPLRATPGLAPEGVMGGIDLVDSGRNVAGGQGDFFDYLTLALAPTAFAGYGVSKLPAAARAVDQTAARVIINNALKNPRMSIGMTPAGVEGAIRSGRVKNFAELNEEGTDIIRAPGYFDERIRIEEDVFGIPRDTPGAQRPTYGALTSGTYLPYVAANKLPGVTGETVRMLDPRFNRSLSSYAYALNSNASDVASQGVARTRPGVQGSYTISDSFLEPGRVFQFGNPADRTEATNEIFQMLMQNTDPKSFRGNPLTRGPVSYPYIEMQASSATNPFNYIEKIDVPITSPKGNPFGISPEAASSRANAIQQLLASEGRTGITSGTLQAVEPAYVNKARQTALNIRNTPPMRAVRDASYQVSQIPKNIRRRQLIKNPQVSTNPGTKRGVNWLEGDQIL
jgi:hypothetical protein